MTYEKEVQVLVIARATESGTGEGIYQIVFGEVLPVDEELKRSIPIQSSSKPPKNIYSNSLIVFAKFLDEVPYIVGSRWLLNIADNGIMSLKKVKK